MRQLRNELTDRMSGTSATKKMLAARTAHVIGKLYFFLIFFNFNKTNVPPDADSKRDVVLSDKSRFVIGLTFSYT